MAIAYVARIGEDSYNGTSVSSRVLTLTAAATVGQTVVAFVAGNGSTTLSTITDSKGNTWTVVGNTANGSTENVALAYCHVATALVFGDTVTATWSGSGSTRLVRLHVFSGLDTGLGVDQTLGATGASITPSVTLGTTVAADELIVSVDAVVGTTATTPGTGYTELDEFATTAGTNDRQIHTQYRIVAATGAYVSNATYAVSKTWAIRAATLRAGSAGSAHALNGVADGASSSNAIRLTLSHPLTATTSGASDAAATRLTTAHALTGDAAGDSAATTTRLIAGQALAGASAGASTASAEAIGVGHALTGAATGAAAAAAARLTTAHALAASAGGTSAVTVDRLAVGHVLAGAAAGTSAAAGELSTGGQTHPLTGSVAASSLATALRLTMAHPLGGDLAGGSSAAALAIQTAHVLSALAAGDSLATATRLAVGHALAGMAAGSSGASATLGISDPSHDLTAALLDWPGPGAQLRAAGLSATLIDDDGASATVLPGGLTATLIGV